MNDKDRLRSELYELLTQFAESGDARVLLTSEAERVAADLLAKAQDTAAGAPAIHVDDGYVLGYFYWYRFLGGEPAQAHEDKERARTFFRALWVAAPGRVPDELRDELFEDQARRRDHEAVNLGKRASELYEQARANRDLDALDETIALAERIVALDLSDRVATHFHAGLSDRLRDRYEWVGDLSDLDAAIAAARTAVDTSASTSTDYRDRLDSLVTRRAETSGLVTHWDDVITVRRGRLDVASDELRGGAAVRLAAALLKRHELRPDSADVHAAVELLRHLTAGDVATIMDRFTLLQTCYFGDSIVDLSELVEAGWAALAQLPADDKDAPAVRANLAYFCLHRYEETGNSGDLVDAVSLAHEAVEAMADDDGRLVTGRRILANVLTRRHEQATRTDAVHGWQPAVDSDLDNALGLFRWCVDQMPADDPGRADLLDDIGATCLRAADRGHRPEMFDEAIEAYREAAAASIGPEEKSHCLRKLARSFQQRYLAFQREADLDSAVEIAQQALAVALPDSRGQRRARLGLAEVLATRLMDHPERDQDRQAAVQGYREISYDKDAGIKAQASAARSWGHILHEAERYDEALVAYDHMLHLLSDIAPVSLGEADRIRRVENWETSAQIPVACALATGQLERAVELLERARLLTAPAVRVAAADVENLRRHHPELASQLDAAQREVAANTLNQRVTFMPLGIALVPKQLSTTRHRLETAASTWQATVRQIRGMPGFERFLMPTTYEELRRAADRGPIAIPLTSPNRCDVLLLTPAGVEVLPLAVTEDEVVDMANRYGQVLRDIGGGAGSLAQRIDLEERLASILTWLWHSTVRPTLEALGYLALADGSRAPHMWWSPTGIFSLFPLHAAGLTPRDGAIDRVRSSYTPSLRLLAHLSTETRGTSETAVNPPRLLAVGLTETPSLTHDPLPNVERELATASRAFPTDRQTVLRDADATVEAVRTALPRHDWLHFACHGRQYPRDPSSSQLYLHDGTLSVSTLRWTDLRHNRLAILSACETAMTGSTLMDEGLHLSAAMHIAGCPEVVGTLWSVGDSSAAQVIEHLYRNLTRGGEPGTGQVATALHLAVRELRAEAPEQCSSWAPFVHLGTGQ